jgi:hypothetical protein
LFNKPVVQRQINATIECSKNRLCYKCRDLPPLIQANFDPVDMSTNENHFILFSDFIKQKMQQQLSIMWLP